MENNIEEQIRSRMQDLGIMVQRYIPDDWGFVVLTYKHNEKGQLIYVSNSNRENVVDAMKEFIIKTEQNYGNDTTKYAKQKLPQYKVGN